MANTGQTGPKLTAKSGKGKYRLEIVKLLALGFSPALVSQELKDNYDIEITRQTIRDSYLIPKRRLIDSYRERMAKELMSEPLADKKTRLRYLLKALDHALTWGTDKLYFSKDGELLGKVEKVNIGVISNLIKEAREEIEGKQVEKTGVKISLLQIIKEVSNNGNGNGHARFDITTETRVGKDIEGAADSLDKQGSRDFQIL